MSKIRIPPVLLLLLCWLSWSIPAFANSIELPDLGDPSLRQFDSATEKKYGELFYQALRANAEFVDDELVEHYVSSLGQRLASHSDAAETRFKFFVIRSNVINAFAGPDAYIGINSGLILRANNESELASVLAHEIAHVSQRHLARMFSRQDTSTALTLGAIVAAILVGSQSPEAAQALIATGVAGSVQSSINFTRDNEYEADRVGIGILGDAGIDPRGMVGFFRILLEESHGLQIEYLRTHPLNINRVSEAEHRISDEKLRGRSDTEDFRFTRARLAALTVERPEDALQAISGEKDVDQVYRKALLLMRTGETGKAIELLQGLQQSSQHPWVRLALADALEQAGELQRAVELTASLTRLFPGYLPVTIAHARLSLEHGSEIKPVITLLKHQLQTDNKVSLHQLLAKAYFQNGQISAALESTGNQYELQGYTELALQQYENARNQSDVNASAKSRLDKKIEMLSAEVQVR